MRHGGQGAVCTSLSRRILGCWARLQLQQRLEVEEESAGTGTEKPVEAAASLHPAVTLGADLEG